jgi:hypothetical protein
MAIEFLPPPTDHFPVRPKGFLGGLLPVSVIKLHDPQPLPRNFILSVFLEA